MHLVFRENLPEPNNESMMHFDNAVFCSHLHYNDLHLYLFIARMYCGRHCKYRINTRIQAENIRWSHNTRYLAYLGAFLL